MDAIQKILVPTDFSAHADEAFRVANKLALATGAKLIAFHIARPPAVVSEGGRLVAQADNSKIAMPANQWDLFKGLPAADPKVQVEHEVIVADRPTAHHILAILDRMGCDLIVMGTHGHSWLKHLLFGSVTEEVVRQARCPVMVVHAPAKKPVPRAVHASAAPEIKRAEHHVAK